MSYGYGYGYGLTTVTPATDEPVSLDEAKVHLRVDSIDEDDLIQSLISAARQQVENHTRHALLTRTYDLALPCFGGCIELPWPPLQSVTGVFYTAVGASEATVAPSVYVVTTSGVRGRITQAYGQYWPVFTAGIPYPVRVRFVAGFGDVDDVPAEIKQAILLIVGALYENREAVTSASVGSRPLTMGVTSLLADWWGRGR